LVTLALSVVAFEALVPRAPESHDVLVATRSIRAGEVIGAGDVKAITVASSQLQAVGAASRQQVVGRTATLDVAAGQPLVDADLGQSSGPGPGNAVVGLSLSDGRFPGDVATGDTVVVVDTPAAAGGSSTPATGPGVELASGRILTVARSSDGTKTEITLVVPTSLSDAVASASAADSVSLVWVTK
jgi:hypothetical protein